MLVGKGEKDCSVKEFYAYIGLELGMNLLKFNEIKCIGHRASFLAMRHFRTQCLGLALKKFVHVFASVH